MPTGPCATCSSATTAATCPWTARRSSARPSGWWSSRPSKALADAGLTAADVDLLVPHQANLRIIQAACQRLGIPEERTAVVIDRYGNTSSASIPLALDDAVTGGRVRRATTCSSPASAAG